MRGIFVRLVVEIAGAVGAEGARARWGVGAGRAEGPGAQSMAGVGIVGVSCLKLGTVAEGL